MLFLDVDPLEPGSPGFYATVAHELQHLINFSQTIKTGAIRGQQEIWIDEGLSSAAEYLYGGTRQDRINYFNTDPLHTIAYGNNFFVWDGYWETRTVIPETGNKKDQLANYATAYLFFQWLRIHASNGTGIYKDIINSGYPDYLAVTGAAGGRIDSVFNSWDTLLSTWMIANAIKASSGQYGYKGQIIPVVNPFSGTAGNRNLFPGEGVYSNLVGSKSPTGSGVHIKYAGIPNTGTTIGRTAPYTGKYLLTYNANTDTDGASEPGTVYQSSSSVLMSLNRSAAAVPANPLPASYPIGFHDKVAEREFRK
jgi:hypothetical protein